VLTTPVVLATVARTGMVPPRPYAYACVRLANSGSLLLPISNLTNLLAFAASGLSFGRFALLMTLPWLIAWLTEWLALRGFFRADLRAVGARPPAGRPIAPRFAVGVLAATTVGFAASFSLHLAVAWAALAGCGALLVPRLAHRDVTARRLISKARPGFRVFVLALSVIVDGVTRHGPGTALRHVLPNRTSLGALLELALLAAVLANVVNNLPRRWCSSPWSPAVLLPSWPS
jgi:arsenical pump membrane protein